MTTRPFVWVLAIWAYCFFFLPAEYSTLDRTAYGVGLVLASQSEYAAILAAFAFAAGSIFVAHADIRFAIAYPIVNSMWIFLRDRKEGVSFATISFAASFWVYCGARNACASLEIDSPYESIVRGATFLVPFSLAACVEPAFDAAYPVVRYVTNVGLR
jgi:hypothetical protein